MEDGNMIYILDMFLNFFDLNVNRKFRKELRLCLLVVDVLS